MTQFYKSKTVILTLIVLSQLVVIGALAIGIYNQKSKILGTVSVNPIKKQSLFFNPESELKYFYEPNPNSVQDNELPWQEGAYVKNTINSDALNERYEYSIPKSDNVFRIISLGDSFTFGAYVNTPENYTERLEDLLNGKIKCSGIDKFEVINLGVPGYDIQYALERYKLRGKKYNPDLVTWFIWGDLMDLNEILLPKISSHKEKLKELGEYGQLVKKGDYCPECTKALEEFTQEYNRKDILNYQSQILDQASIIIEAPLLFFTFSYSGYEAKGMLKMYTNSHNFLFDSITDIWNRPKLVFPDGHPSPNGHTLIAQELFEYLLREEIIPCS